MPNSIGGILLIRFSGLDASLSLLHLEQATLPKSWLRDVRGDRTPLELFLAGDRGWEAGLRRRMDDGKPEQE